MEKNKNKENDLAKRKVAVPQAILKQNSSTTQVKSKQNSSKVSQQLLSLTTMETSLMLKIWQFTMPPNNTLFEEPAPALES